MGYIVRIITPSEISANMLYRFVCSLSTVFIYPRPLVPSAIFLVVSHSFFFLGCLNPLATPFYCPSFPFSLFCLPYLFWVFCSFFSLSFSCPFSKPTNLNEMSHQTAIDLVKRVISLGVNVQELYVDTVGIASSYQARLQSIFPNITITVESKADDTYPIVSAASIAAKVARDRIIALWQHPERVTIPREFGSGYPSDPGTQRFLAAHLDPVFGYPSIVRFSWQTAKKIIEARAVVCSSLLLAFCCLCWRLVADFRRSLPLDVFLTPFSPNLLCFCVPLLCPGFNSCARCDLKCACRKLLGPTMRQLGP